MLDRKDCLVRVRYLGKHPESRLTDHDPLWAWDATHLDTGRTFGGHTHSYEEAWSKIDWLFS